MEGVPGLRVVLVKLIPGLEGVLIGGRALGVDGGVDEVGVSLLPGLLKALLEHEGGELGVGGNLGGGQEHAVKLLGREVHTVPILLVPHGDGEGQRLDVQLLPKLSGDVGGGIGQKLDASHIGLLHFMKLPLIGRISDVTWPLSQKGARLSMRRGIQILSRFRAFWAAEGGGCRRGTG